MGPVIALSTAYADPEGGSGPPPPLKNQKNIGFLSNIGLDPLKNHKAIKPVFNFGPSSARKQKAIKMEFRWRANEGPVTLPPLSSKKTLSRLDP